MSETVLPRVTRTFGLRGLLAIDGTTCLSFGVLLLVLTNPLAELCGLPSALLTYAGVLLLPIGAVMLLTARMRPPARALVWMVIGGNALWVLASLGLLVIFATTGFGATFLILQALAVAVLAWLELRALQAEE